MLKRICNWLDDRTGYRDLLVPVRQRVVPGGPSWERTTASCLTGMLAVIVVTGLLLMLRYSPSTSSAWASVHFIEGSRAGSFLRGLHYYGAQALIILFAIHTLRIMLRAAFRAPHELIWITGLLLLPLVLIWAITGNPLSGSQKGFSQIEVEGNIIASTPLVGRTVQRLLIGGDEVGNLTLTTLYFLHVALLPLLVGLLLVVHIGQVYRHGLSTSSARGGIDLSRLYWPHQTVRNTVVFALVLGVVATLAWKHGAPLDVPADADLPYWTRPEWYFLFLFELRRYFVGDWEVIATVVIPSLVLILLLTLPLLDRACSPRVKPLLRGLIVVAGIAAWGGLTFASVWRDRNDAEHQELIGQLHRLGTRARELADRQGVPPVGAVSLLRNDPQTQGPLLFRQHCASCHPHVDENGQGIVAEEPSAPNLYDFASAAWIGGFLDPERILSEHYFGKTAFADGEMAEFIGDTFEDADDEDARRELHGHMQKVAVALAAEARDPDPGQPASPEVTEGIELLTSELGCIDCHRFGDEGDLGSAPDLTGYGSHEWLKGIISNPEHERFYPDTNDRMPAYAASADDPESHLLTDHELDLLVRWLRGEDAVVDAND